MVVLSQSHGDEIHHGREVEGSYVIVPLVDADGATPQQSRLASGQLTWH
jgi:hypothetical protein